jgi:hypothetical protein
MQVDFSKVFKQFDGAEIPENPGSDKGFTLRAACVNSLMFLEQGEKLTGEEQIKRFDLATAIYACIEPLDLQAEQITLIKAQVTKTYGPIIVAQAWKMLEGQL